MNHTLNIDNWSTPVTIAVLSFCLGTFLFGLYMVLPDEALLVIGILYVLAAIFFNSLSIMHLLYQLICTSKSKEETCLEILIVLSNIPIAYFYLYIILNKY